MTSAIAPSAPRADWRARLFRDWGGRLWLFSLLVLAALLAADLSVPVDSRLHLLLVDALLPLLDVIAVVLAVRASRTSRLDGATRLAWGRLVLAFGLFFAGDIGYELRGVLDPAAASAPDVLVPYLLFYPVFLWAVLSFPGVVRGRDEGRKFWLDAASVVIGGGMLLWHWVMAPALTRALGGGPRLMLPLSFPLLDLMHLAAFSTVMLRQPRNPVFRTLAAAILFGLASDVLYGVELLAGSETAGGTSDMLLAFQWVLFAGAGHLQFVQGRGAAPAERAPLLRQSRRAVSPLPYLALGVGYFTLLVAAWNSPSGSFVVLAVMATLLSAVVATRQFISARENAQLEAEHARRRLEARFEALVESSADVIALIGADATFRYVSGAVEGALGRRREELLGRSAFEFMDPDDVARCQRVLEQALANPGVHYHLEFRFRHADGQWRELEADGVNRLDDPEIQGIAATIRDVTARRRSERELRGSEERFRTLASSLLAAEAELRARKELSENLLAVARATTEHPSLETTLRNALTVMKQLVAAEGGSILLVDEPGRLQGRVYADGDPCLLVDPRGVEQILSAGLAGWVARHREAALVADTLQDERWLPLASEPIRSALCVPIASGAQLVGILTLVHSRTSHFTQAHLELARAAAEQIALALRNAQVFDVVGRMASRQRLLNDVLRTATGRTDPGTVLSAAVELIARRTRWPSVALSVPEAGRWKIRASVEEWARIADQPVADGVVGRAYKSGEIQLVPDVSLDPDYVSASPSIQSELAVPLRRGERILGVMNVESDVKNAFDEDDIKLAGALADTVALALEEAELYRGLAEESERLGAVIDSSRDGILLIGQDGKILVINDPALRLLGREGESAGWIGEPALKAGLPEALLAPNGAVEGETQLGAALVTWRRQAVAAGPSIGQLVVLHDVTVARRAENLREELTHTLVHDLRSPLNSIMGFLEILEQAPSLPGSQQELLSIARRATRRLVSLVDTILDVSRLEKGALPLEPVPVRVAPLAAEVLDLQKPVAKHRGVALHNEVPSDLPEAWADAELLLRILENLVSNALRHTPRGGEVRVGARSEPGGGVRLSVADTGGGIPDFEQKHVFEKFVTGAQGGPRGTGLGLAFCRLAVEAHGGRIWIESEAGRGATFLLTLPARSEG